ncbi:unnamed protein product [Leptosia nina]|uniref:Swi5-dependent recombination DNA repair protein 1 homolog n=1 Tax=Leptosia nina TaxID=320188 RepID=A0AAV1IUS1_9NEOP
MNPVSKLNTDSPKTPGGISKSLLTPCRRVGLSRKFNKKGPSPFISPLSSSTSSTNNVVETPKREQKKRKVASKNDEESKNNLPSTPETIEYQSYNKNIISTPLRNVPLSKRKSKTHILMQDEDIENKDDKNSIEVIHSFKDVTKISSPDFTNYNCTKKAKNDDNKSTMEIDSSDVGKNNAENFPNNLAKECFVVIHKKMLKNLRCKEPANTQVEKPKSQSLFDSDSDDVPLCDLNKPVLFDNCDNVFVESKKHMVKKPALKNTISKNKSSTMNNQTQMKNTTPQIVAQSACDDDDDFECSKKTIIVKKSYNKMIKPIKAKSTGSITERDIDNLKARIEMKKKLLEARVMTEDSNELRNLVKKWQKGFQEAFMELFDLMREKLPDCRNMDFSEILQTLQIPPGLVGYDVDKDCFVTPDDSNILFSSINN